MPTDPNKANEKASKRGGKGFWASLGKLVGIGVDAAAEAAEAAADKRAEEAAQDPVDTVDRVFTRRPAPNAQIGGGQPTTTDESSSAAGDVLAFVKTPTGAAVAAGTLLALGVATGAVKVPGR